MAARFFVAENELALGKFSPNYTMASSIRGTPDCRMFRGEAWTDDWLPVVGASRLVVISRDQRIRYRPVEKLLWLEHRVRGFVLTGPKRQSTATAFGSSNVTGAASRPW